MLDGNTSARLRFEREQEKLYTEFSAAKADLANRIQEAVDNGEMDSDLANYFDSEVLVRIARTVATSKDLELDLSRIANDLIDIRHGLLCYVEDLADEGARNV